MKPMQRSPIGLALVAFLLLSLQPQTAHAAESASFTVEGGSLNTTEAGMQSENFRGQGALGWHQETLHGSQFTLVPDQDAGTQPDAPIESSSSASSASSDASAESHTSATTPSPGGHRGHTTNKSRSSVSKYSSQTSSAYQLKSSTQSFPTSADTHDANYPIHAIIIEQSSSTSRSSDARQIQTTDVPETWLEDTLQSYDEQFFTPATEERSAIGADSPWLHSAAENAAVTGRLEFILILSLMVLVVAVLLIIAAGFSALYASKIRGWMTVMVRRKRVKRMLLIIGWIIALCAAVLLTLHAHAESIPLTHSYDGRLLNASGSAVTSEVNIRFSYWSSGDVSNGDVAGDGSIDTNASNYLDWQEEHTVTPDSNGYFSVEMGSIQSLPGYASLPSGVTVHLQVEVKNESDADTSYEILDPDTQDTAIDRTAILSVPYASVAETLQRRSIGTGSGSIPLLQSGGLLPVSAIPDGTNRDSFTIDADNTASDILLQFGESLGETLKFSVDNGRFEFSDDVHIEGDLTVTGTVNGVDLSTIGDPVATNGEIVLHPGFEGAAFQGDGTENVGQLSVSHDNINLRNYYLWTSSRTSLQDYDVLLRFTLPDDFTSWDDSLTISYRSTSANTADNNMDIQVYDTNGSPVTLSGSALNLASTSWQTTHIEFIGSPTWTAGQECMIRFKLSAKDNYQMQLGSIRFSLTETQ